MGVSIIEVNSSQCFESLVWFKGTQIGSPKVTLKILGHQINLK
jgi:hypothetical protein